MRSLTASALYSSFAFAALLSTRRLDFHHFSHPPAPKKFSQYLSAQWNITASPQTSFDSRIPDAESMVLRRAGLVDEMKVNRCSVSFLFVNVNVKKRDNNIDVTQKVCDI
jgi:hypothetical protein